MVPMIIDANTVLVVAVLAVLLFGPEKLPELVKKTARVVKFLRGVANSATDQLKTELGPELAELNLDDIRLSDLRQPQRLLLRTLLRDVQGDLDDIKTQVTGLQRELSLSPGAPTDSIRDGLAEIKQAVDKTASTMLGVADAGPPEPGVADGGPPEPEAADGGPPQPEIADGGPPQPEVADGAPPQPDSDGGSAR